MKKKKVLILSYYFPPANMTASERIQSWAQFLGKHGFYPVIVTRNWDVDVKNSADLVRPSGQEMLHKKHNDYEVYYVPYKASLKDKALLRFYGRSGYPVYLGLAFLYGIKEVITDWGSPLLPLYKQAEKLLQVDEREWHALIVSGNPFELFHFGYRLHKQFDIPWIADYRDDWTTNEVHLSSNFFKRLIQKLSRKAELRWVGSAAAFMSVSSHYVQKINSLFPAKPGYVLLNGYLPENYTQTAALTGTFTICYTGSLYPKQPIEIFLKAFCRFYSNYPHVKMIFVGIATDYELIQRIRRAIVGYEQAFVFTERVSKEQAIAYQQSASVLLAVAHKDTKGTPGSKLYEYIALQKPVLVCPTDHEIIEDTLRETGQGIFANDVESCYQQLIILNERFQKGDLNSIKTPVSVYAKYSREGQVNILADILHQLQPYR